MNIEEFRTNAHALVDWMADFLAHIEDRPVKSRVKPKEVINQLPVSPPGQPESFKEIFADVERVIMPGMTHWQHPKFLAFFNANASPPSILAEMLMATLGAQCMIWETSPAAAELEERMMDWLKQMIGLPANWAGVIHDTASAATLISLLSAREKATGLRSNREGMRDLPQMRIYCTAETHSSIEKAVKVAGFGSENIVHVLTRADLTMDPEMLREAIVKDREKGFLPLAVVSTLGTTSTLAIDDLESLSIVTSEEGVWHHVDAAYAGTAAILPEYRQLVAGIEKCDSFVFNPHKWMFVNFDCTAYFVREKEWLIRTFEILPEYLKTKSRGQVNDYRDWGIALGRRFRALKLWFVIRSYGVEGLRALIRKHIGFGEMFERWVRESPDFEIIYPRNLNFMVFRFNPGGLEGEDLDHLNRQLLDCINTSGRMYLTHAVVHGKYGMRIVLGQTYQEIRHVREAWSEINQFALEIKTLLP